MEVARSHDDFEPVNDTTVKTTMLSKMKAKNAKTNRGFTLVELLVVIAITAVLFTLLLDPLVNSFKLTQRAQMLAGAQDQARITMENLTRELGSATYVFTNTTLPIGGTHPTTTPTIPDLHFTNFLILDAPKNTSPVSDVPAVAFNAKLDFVLPRHVSNGDLTDPTTGQPINISTAGTVGPTSLTFPLAPGTTMIRYWVGLTNPTKQYSTQGEGALLAQLGNNPYVLYRAEFNPTNTIDTATGKPKVNADGSTVNEDLFAPKLDASGNATDTPELDDPDFFRTVTTSDINWLDPTHGTYTAQEVTDHNARVDKWAQIAKPVIGIPNVDLILLPHNSDNSIAYDPTTGQFPLVAHSGSVHDPVTGTDWPVVNTSVRFTPASISADAQASTTSDNASSGYGGDVAAVNNGLPYVPTVYTASEQSWSFPYHISLYPQTDTSAPLYSTLVADQTNGSMYQAGDLLEMYTNEAPGTGVLAYDITSGLPLTTNGRYIPMTVAPDTGTITFGIPALPFPATSTTPNPYNRYWSLPLANFQPVGSGTDPEAGVSANGLVNLGDNKQLPNTPLPSVLTANYDASAPVASPDLVQNARVVPDSLRVYGPDATPGPDQGQSVLYTAVSPGSSSFGPNEYTVDYANNSLMLYVDPATASLPTPATSNVTVQIAFDYQANLAAANPSNTISTDNAAAPLSVKVDYQTRDLLDVTLGVRVYDPSNVGPAQIVTVHNQVRIGNSNR
jgi:prepilin-type N-terminal cleavage/methylation domain-containing protein